MAYHNSIFTLCSAFAIILVLIPMRWHMQAKNIGTCLYMFWTALGCFTFFVNSIVWNNNIEIHSAGWCDLSTRIQLAAVVGVPAASLCIVRRLYYIVSDPSILTTPKDKKRQTIVDLAIGLGIPLLQPPLQYIVAGNRFDIWGDIGCVPATYNVYPAYPLVLAWPIILGCVSAVYCVLTLRHFIRMRRDMATLVATNSDLSMSRYYRLMALCVTEILFTIPIASYGLHQSSKRATPWISWADTHSNFSNVYTYPAGYWRIFPALAVSVELQRWVFVLCAVVFFAYFGFADEARRNYAMVASALNKRFGFSALKSKSSGREPSMQIVSPTITPVSALPIFMKHTRKDTKNSMDSGSSKDSTSFFFPGGRRHHDFSLNSSGSDDSHDDLITRPRDVAFVV